MTQIDIASAQEKKVSERPDAPKTVSEADPRISNMNADMRSARSSTAPWKSWLTGSCLAVAVAVFAAAAIISSAGLAGLGIALIALPFILIPVVDIAKGGKKIYYG